MLAMPRRDQACDDQPARLHCLRLLCWSPPLAYNPCFCRKSLVLRVSLFPGQKQKYPFVAAVADRCLLLRKWNALTASPLA